jgi:hypothetical protein
MRDQRVEQAERREQAGAAHEIVEPALRAQARCCCMQPSQQHLTR